MKCQEKTCQNEAVVKFRKKFVCRECLTKDEPTYYEDYVYSGYSTMAELSEGKNNEYLHLSKNSRFSRKLTAAMKSNGMLPEMPVNPNDWIFCNEKQKETQEKENTICFSRRRR